LTQDEDSKIKKSCSLPVRGDMALSVRRLKTRYDLSLVLEITFHGFGGNSWDFGPAERDWISGFESGSGIFYTSIELVALSVLLVNSALLVDKAILL